jgi:hypothetical protein
VHRNEKSVKKLSVSQKATRTTFRVSQHTDFMMWDFPVYGFLRSHQKFTDHVGWVEHTERTHPNPVRSAIRRKTTHHSLEQNRTNILSLTGLFATPILSVSQKAARTTFRTSKYTNFVMHGFSLYGFFTKPSIFPVAPVGGHRA